MDVMSFVLGVMTTCSVLLVVLLLAATSAAVRKNRSSK